MSTHLYRAVVVKPFSTGPSVMEQFVPGRIIGRQSGYLSRTSAKEVAAGAPDGCVAVVKSDPVIFPDVVTPPLTRAELVERLVNTFEQLREAIR